MPFNGLTSFLRLRRNQFKNVLYVSMPFNGLTSFLPMTMNEIMSKKGIVSMPFNGLTSFLQMSKFVFDAIKYSVNAL